VPGLSRNPTVSSTIRLIFGCFREILGYGLIEQGAVERLVKAASVAGLLWLAIWWALS
jgi:hypothetical protein